MNPNPFLPRQAKFKSNKFLYYFIRKVGRKTIKKLNISDFGRMDLWRKYYI